MVANGHSYRGKAGPDNTLIYVITFVVITLILYRCILPTEITPEETLNITHDVGFKVVETEKQKEGVNEAVTLGEVGVSNGEKVLIASDDKDSTGKDKVVKQRSSKDYKYYYVSAVLDDKVEAANKLSELNRRVQYLLQTIDESLDGGRKVHAKDGVDITSNMRTLVKKHYNKPLPVANITRLTTRQWAVIATKGCYWRCVSGANTIQRNGIQTIPYLESCHMNLLIQQTHNGGGTGITPMGQISLGFKTICLKLAGILVYIAVQSTRKAGGGIVV